MQHWERKLEMVNLQDENQTTEAEESNDADMNKEDVDPESQNQDEEQHGAFEFVDREDESTTQALGS